MKSPFLYFAIGFVVLADSALGAVTIFTDHNLWAAAAGTVEVENFDSISQGSISHTEGPVGSVRFFVSTQTSDRIDFRLRNPTNTETLD